MMEHGLFRGNIFFLNHLFPRPRAAVLSLASMPECKPLAWPAIGYGTYKVGVIPASASSQAASSSAAAGDPALAEDIVKRALAVRRFCASPRSPRGVPPGAHGWFAGWISVPRLRIVLCERSLRR